MGSEGKPYVGRARVIRKCGEEAWGFKMDIGGRANNTGDGGNAM